MTKRETLDMYKRQIDTCMKLLNDKVEQVQEIYLSSNAKMQMLCGQCIDLSSKIDYYTDQSNKLKGVKKNG